MFNEIIERTRRGTAAWIRRPGPHLPAMGSRSEQNNFSHDLTAMAGKLDATNRQSEMMEPPSR